jgi:hypothetical protein
MMNFQKSIAKKFHDSEEKLMNRLISSGKEIIDKHQFWRVKKEVKSNFEKLYF